MDEVTATVIGNGRKESEGLLSTKAGPFSGGGRGEGEGVPDYTYIVQGWKNLDRQHTYVHSHYIAWVSYCHACLHFLKILPLQAVLGGTRKALRHTEMPNMHDSTSASSYEGMLSLVVIMSIVSDEGQTQEHIRKPQQGWGYLRTYPQTPTYRLIFAIWAK